MPDLDNTVISASEIRHLNILVKDLNRSWDFYKDVLKFEYRYHLAPTKIVAEFNGFDFYIEQDTAWRPIDNRVHFGLRTTRRSVLAWAQFLDQKGIVLVKGNNPTAEVFMEPGSNRVALYFQDPDGWTIEIYSAE